MLASLWLHAHQKKLWCAAHSSVLLLFSLSSHSVTLSLSLSSPSFPIEEQVSDASHVLSLFGHSVFEARLLQLLCFGLESGQMFVFLILVSGVDLRFWEAALIVFPVCSSGAVMILIEGKWKIQTNAKEQPRCVSLLQWWRPDFRLALFVFSLLGLFAVWIFSGTAFCF